MNIKPYNRRKAVDYAHKWAFGRNPQYYDFSDIGGDCTNFASQVILAGAGVMNYNPVKGWYFVNSGNRSPAWSGVEFLHNFLINNKESGPVAEDTTIENAAIGDIAQLSFNGTTFQHSPMIVSIGNPPSPENIYVAAHTFNADNRQLSTYKYQKVRFVHITHVNTW